MRPTPLSIAAFFVLATGAVLLRSGVAPKPVERDAPVRPSLHAAPPEDVARLNALVPRCIPDAIAETILPDDRPAVVLFLKANCGCSEDFARMFTTIEPHLRPRASCLAVIEAANGEAEPFLKTTGLATRYLIEADGSLARRWGVVKAGCMALVGRDGAVEAIWPGISRQGFRDLAHRLGDPGLLGPDTLTDLPGAATAGCPLDSAASSLPTGVSR